MKRQTFRPGIGPLNIKAKPPENHGNILLSGRNALLMNGSPVTRLRAYILRA